MRGLCSRVRPGWVVLLTTGLCSGPAWFIQHSDCFRVSHVCQHILGPGRLVSRESLTDVLTAGCTGALLFIPVLTADIIFGKSVNLSAFAK